MQKKDRITDSHYAPLTLFRACRDCVTMTAVLFFAVLTTLIIGL